jgi:hypothetical protein
VAGLPLQVNDCPVLITLLDMANIQRNCFVTSHAACQQHCQKRSITLPLQLFAARNLP